MGIGRFIGKQFVDVIDWVDEPGVLALRYPMQDREIQNGAQLTVREGQAAAFLNQGRLGDILGPGQHTLTTANLPVLTALANWDKAFASPFKADVYFVSLREQLDRKWGVAQPITVRDPDLGVVRIRAHGRFAFAVEDVGLFWKVAVGNLGRFTTEDIEPQLRAAIVTQLAALLGEGSHAFLDLASQQAALSQQLQVLTAPEFARLGLKLTTLYIESLSLPEDVQAHLDSRAAMRAVGDLGEYARFQAADSFRTAAANEGGLAGLGAGAAAGVAVGQAMAGALNPAGAPGAAAPQDPFALIEKLHQLLKAGALSQAEFDAKKAELLGKIG